MHIVDFQALGELAPAGLRATKMAVERAKRSAVAGRIPIAGAAVHQGPNGVLTTVSVGCNGRIPDDDGPGYPTDHGETAAVRGIDDVSAWDWSRIVFATTLSPCIMCTRTLAHLHGLGLRHLVIAEAQTFTGRTDLLAGLPGMRMVELTNADAVILMRHFARTYPWDWAADIGEIPPLHRPEVDDAALIAAVRAKGHDAGLFDAGGELVVSDVDERARHGGNPVQSAAMRVMGRAGSAINLREHVLVQVSDRPIDVDVFGASSLGACELFRPAALVGDAPVSPGLREALRAAGVDVRCPEG